MEVEAKKDFGDIEEAREACWNFIKELGIKYERKTIMGYAQMLYRKLEKKKSKK